MKTTITGIVVCFVMMGLLLAACPSQRYVCDNDKRERLIMECLDRTSAHIVNPGEDVDLGSAVWHCKDMAKDLSCWYEKEKQDRI